MPISRLQFMLGIGAGVMLPFSYKTVQEHFKNFGESLIDVPGKFEAYFFAVYTGFGEFELNLCNPHAGPLEITVREFALDHCGSGHAYQPDWRECEKGSFRRSD